MLGKSVSIFILYVLFCYSLLLTKSIFIYTLLIILLRFAWKERIYVKTLCIIWLFITSIKYIFAQALCIV